MEAFKLFDPYSLRARLFPALWASASLVVALGVLVPRQLSGFQGLAAVAVPVLFFVMAEIARHIGKKREPQLYEAWGGMPTVRLMRHADQTVDPKAKAAHLAFIASKLNETAPTAEEEKSNPAAADAFYRRCGDWLRENTRDTQTFKILFEENVSYGARRNLFALKWPVFVVDAVLFMTAAGYLLYVRPELDGDQAFKAFLVVGFSALHGLCTAAIATETSVREAANTYARQLLLSCETLRSQPPAPNPDNKKAG